MARKGRPQPPMGTLRRLDAGARAAFPALGTALLLVLAAVPVGVPGLVAALALPPVFFWSVFRPAAMSPPVVFGLGLLQDLLSFAPLGVGILTLLLVHGAALRMRPWLVRQGFPVVWLCFCAVAVGASAVGFVLTGLLDWHMPSRVPALLQAGLAAGAYPALGWTLGRIHMVMTRAEEGP
ncbi:rod shape-determining protein MreD [Sabulicella glaciei]|nr:rod shape-determining protein MreD [Roseococcus sp. MDT2-1-1]